MRPTFRRAIVVLALIGLASTTGYDIYLRATTQPLTAGGMWIPSRVDESSSAVNGSVHTMDASGEIAAVVFSVPRTGDLQGFEVYVQAVGNTPDNNVVFSFQDVDTTTGLPDGTPDQSVSLAGASIVVGHLNPGNFSTDRAVTRSEEHV